MLLVFAVLIPSVVVIAIGVRLLDQDRELSAKRSEDSRRAVVATINQRVFDRLEQTLAREANAVAVRDTAHGSRYTDPSVALTARVAGGRIIPPWRDDGRAEAFARERDEAEFANAVRQAEATRSTSSYESARSAARTEGQRAYLALSQAQSMGHPAREAKLVEAARTPFVVRDEFGVPFALYAVSALQHEQLYSSLVQSVVEQSKAALLQSRILSPTACYMIRRLDQFADATTAGRCTDLDHAQQLSSAIEFMSATSLEPGPPFVWTFLKQSGWLVSERLAGRDTLLVAIRASDVERAFLPSGARIVSEPATGEPLGKGFVNVYLVPPHHMRVEPLDRLRSFYLIALGAILLFGTISAALLVRDIRRDVATTSLRAQFVSGVTHELKTPLAGIRMFAETIRDRPHISGETRAEYLDTIVSESERLTRLLDNVLDFSRMERGAAKYIMKPVSLLAVIDDVLRIMEHPLAQQQFAIHTVLPHWDPHVRGNADALEQALLNLIANAMKYSGTSRQISLTLTATPSFAEIAVSDRGIGIPADQHALVFEQFYRVPTPENSSVTGAGLGLTIVRHIAASHGGAVSVQSEVGEGSMFTLRIPLLGASVDEFKREVGIIDSMASGAGAIA